MTEEQNDFANKAVDYYKNVLSKRRAYYKLHAKQSNERCKIYYKNMMQDLERKEKYLANRRFLYNKKKEERHDCIQQIVNKELSGVIKNIQIEYEQEKEK